MILNSMVNNIDMNSVKRMSKAFEGTSDGLDGIIEALRGHLPPEPPPPEPKYPTTILYVDGTISSFNISGEINWQSFPNMGSIKEIDIGNEVTCLKAGLFDMNSNISHVTIPNSVTNIERFTFSNCPSLVRLDVKPNNPVYDSRNDCNAIIKTTDNEIVIGCRTTIVPNDIESIGESSFVGSSISSINLPNSITNIKNGAFVGCSSLISIAIPDSVTSIGLYAFDHCSGLSFVTIGNSVTSIDDYAFHGCTALSRITSRRTIAPTIQPNAFGIDSSSYTGYPTRGNNVLKVPQGATGYDTGAWLDPLQNSTKCGFHTEYLPPSPYSKTIATYLNGNVVEYEIEGEFERDTIPSSDAANIIKLELGSKVTDIGKWALSCYDNISSIYIPESITSIDSENEFRNMTIISVNENNTIYDSRNNCNAIIKTADNTLIYGCNNTFIPNTIVNIGSRAFSGCPNLTSLVIPDGVKSIGDHSFIGCSGLTSLTIPDSVSSIGEWAFYSCDNLLSVSIGNGLISIPNNAFNQCGALTSIIIGNGTTNIESFAFSYCRSLSSITIPTEITSIGTKAFNQCPATVTFEGKDKATVQGMANYRWGIGTNKIICTDGTL